MCLQRRVAGSVQQTDGDVKAGRSRWPRRSFLGYRLWVHIMFHSKLANIKTLKCTKHACHIVITELKGIRLGGLCISSAEVARVRLAGFLSPGSQTWPVIP